VSLDPAAARSLGTVRVVGTGLLGTSVALGLRTSGVRVVLADPSPTALALARDVGAGEPDRGDVEVDLVLVAAPPDVTADVVAAEVHTHPDATVTDVASVKSGIVEALSAQGADLSRYVGGHPLAGRERTGPIAARADLFLGRPWVVCPTAKTRPERLESVRALVRALGASPVTMAPGEHDAAVALISHVPQVAASLVASRLREAPDPAVGLAGQGLRDVTRIAGSDATLWAQILAANAGPVLTALRHLRQDLDGVVHALETLAGDGPDDGARATLARLIEDGRTGRERIPGKHGTAPTRYTVVTVLLPDTPGQAGRLFADIGDAGINVEEFSLEHSPGQQVGLAGVSVLPGVREELERALTQRGWHVVG
jgi:prephenate dehydrogenase